MNKELKRALIIFSYLIVGGIFQIAGITVLFIDSSYYILREVFMILTIEIFISYSLANIVALLKTYEDSSHLQSFLSLFHVEYYEIEEAIKGFKNLFSNNK